MPRVKASNRIGQQFGRLTVTALYGRKEDGSAIMLCECSCGAVVTVPCRGLVTRHVQSCGCLNRDLTIERSTVHGMYGSTEYTTWCGMIQRCTNTKAISYPRYGGRGITVCEAWKKFSNFYRDMGPKPSKDHTLDRMDNNGPYCKENCRWATQREQGSNQRTNRLVTLNGKTQTLTQWASESGIPLATLWARLSKYGWTIEKALTTPVNAHRKPSNGRPQQC